MLKSNVTEIFNQNADDNKTNNDSMPAESQPKDQSSEDDNYMELYVEKELKEKIEPLEE